MKKYLLILFISFSGILKADAQTGIIVKGTVKDSAGNAVKGATISLFTFNTQKDTLLSISNSNGNFEFSNVNVDEFKIQVAYIGYGDYEKIFHYPGAKSSIDLGFIQMTRKVGLLQEIIITGNKLITIKEDTLEFKADSFKLRPDADVEALLKKIPGIQIDASGNITAYGKSVNKIRVNGKDFFSGDIKTATKELPANIVDQVQVIDDYGDQSAFTGVKDGDPDKIINLKIKKDKNKGYFGRAQVGYGTNERYNANGSLNYFNNNKQISLLGNFNNTNSSLFSLPGSKGFSGLRGGMPDNGTMNTVSTVMSNGDGGFIQSGQAGDNGISVSNSAGINFRDDISSKLSFYGSYSFTDRNTNTISSRQQTNVFTTGNITNTQNSNKSESSTSHRLFFNAEWKIDSFNQVKITPSFTYVKTSSNTYSDFVYNGNDNNKINDGNTKESYHYTQPGFNANVLYNHRFKKAGRFFSLNYNYAYSSISQDDDKLNNSTNYVQGGGTIVNNQNQLVGQDNINPSNNVRLSYIEPLTKKKSLEFNYTFSRSFTDNDKQTNSITAAGSTRIDSLSNIYENIFSYQRYGINYRYNDKKYNYSIGIAAQANQMKGASFISNSTFKNNSFNIFPVARLTYNFSRTKNLSVNYNATISAPSYSQLQPVYDYSNPQYPVIGNAELLPEFKNTFSARYSNFDFTSGNILFSSLSFSTTNKKVVTNAVRNPGNNTIIQETQYLNADGYYNASGFYNFSKPFKSRKYVITLNGILNYTNDISFINSEKNTGKLLTVTQGLNVSVQLNTWLEVGAGGNFSYNSNKYDLTPATNTNVKTYTLSSNGKIYFPKKFVFNYDLNKSFNKGYAVSANPFIVNGSIEKQFAKNNQMSVRLHAYDIFDQNVNISRTASANSITDTRSNKLGQYFMLSFNLKLQKFKGQQPKAQMPSGAPPDNLSPPRL